MWHFFKRDRNEKYNKRALIVVDEQNDFVEGGALGVAGGMNVVNKTIRYINEHGNEYDLIIITQDWHIQPGSHFSNTPDFINSWPVHCVAESKGAELAGKLSNILTKFDHVSIRKGMYSAAYSAFEGIDENGNTLETVLRDNRIRKVDIVGLAADYCVKETAIDADRLGFLTWIMEDFTVPINWAGYPRLREDLQTIGITVEPFEEEDISAEIFDD